LPSHVSRSGRTATGGSLGRRMRAAREGVAAAVEEDDVVRGQRGFLRHCEPTGRANARPMTDSAKQSISRLAETCIASAFALRASADTSSLSLLVMTSGDT
jgi:hypothetical protein